MALPVYPVFRDSLIYARKTYEDKHKSKGTEIKSKVTVETLKKTALDWQTTGTTPAKKSLFRQNKNY